MSIIFLQGETEKGFFLLQNVKKNEMWCWDQLSVDVAMQYPESQLSSLAKGNDSFY